MEKVNVTMLCPPSEWPKPKLTPAIESEQTVLGAMLLNVEFFVDIKSKLCPSDFFIETHKEIFETMIRLHKKHGTFDAAMLCDALRVNEGDRAYIYELANCCVSTANLAAHTDIIREKSVQRQLIKVANDMQERVEGITREKKLDPHKDHLVLFFAELSAEIDTSEITVEYLSSVLVEVNKALIDSIERVEDDA